MHKAVLVIIGRPGIDSANMGQDFECIKSRVADALEPSGQRHFPEWDWYQIGGRWTGLFDGYEPTNDTNLMKICGACDGSGMRAGLAGQSSTASNWMKSPCNECSGEGRSMTWPTDWPIRAQDILPCSELIQSHIDTCAAVVVGGVWYDRERYEPWQDDGESFQPQNFPPLSWLNKSGVAAVIVDCHN